MTWPQPYLLFPGTARDALTFYADVFGGEASLHSFADFNRTDGPPDAVAHGELSGRVVLFASDAAGDEASLRTEGLMFSMLGTEPELLRGWFDRLAEGGAVVAPLERRPWGDFDGQVVDRFGVRWLIGFKG